MAAAAWWLAFYLVPFGVLAALPGWRGRAVALLLLAALLGWLMLWLRGVETLAFGVGANVVLAVSSGIAGAVVAWLAERLLQRRVPGRQARLIAAGIGGISGFAFVPVLMPALAALFANW